jgi:acetyl esterase
MCCVTRARRMRRGCARPGVAVTTVRYDGITHDFMMLNPLSGTRATRAAVAQAIAVLRDVLHRA